MVALYFYSGYYFCIQNFIDSPSISYHLLNMSGKYKYCDTYSCLTCWSTLLLAFILEPLSHSFLLTPQYLSKHHTFIYFIGSWCILFHWLASFWSSLCTWLHPILAYLVGLSTSLNPINTTTSSKPHTITTKHNMYSNASPCYYPRASLSPCLSIYNQCGIEKISLISFPNLSPFLDILLVLWLLLAWTNPLLFIKCTRTVTVTLIHSIIPQLFLRVFLL